MGAALAFLTVLPARPRGSDRGLDWFPAVGLGLGLLLGATWWITEALLPSGVAAAVVIAADLMLTGMLHLDGVADSADGLLPHLERERRLEVMSDPHAGSFAVGAVVVVLLLRWSALASMAVSPLVLAGLWCLSRSAMALTIQRRDHARADGGLAAGLGGGEQVWAAVGLALALLLLTTGGGAGGILVFAAAGMSAVAVVELARRRIGGYTGDVLGAAGMMAETIGLVVASGMLPR